MQNTFLMAILVFFGYLVSTFALKGASIPTTSIMHGDFSTITTKYSAEIVVFTSSTCIYCAEETAYLDKHHIRYKEVVVDKNKADMDYLLHELKQDSVPVIVDETRLLSGFDIQLLGKFIANQRRRPGA